MATRFKDLLEYLGDDVAKAAKNEAIIRYFNNENRSEFEIDEEIFYVYDEREVKEMLKEQYEEEAKDFMNTLQYSDYGKFVELIDTHAMIEELVYDFDFDKVDYLKLLDSDEYYIYTDE